MTNPKKYSMKSKKSEKGQISLEFLILIAAFLSAMLLFVPIANKAYNLGIFGIESAKAKNFTKELKQKIEEMNFLGNNSRIEIAANPATEWIVSIENKKIKIKIKNDFLEEEKTIEEEFKIEIEPLKIEKILNSKTIFALEKANNKIWLKSIENSGG